jgi:hypothetical protein
MDSDRLLQYEEANSISNCFDKLFFPWTSTNIEEFLQECGLVSTHVLGLWLLRKSRVSCLKIIDNQKYFLAKIKYGF